MGDRPTYLAQTDFHLAGVATLAGPASCGADMATLSFKVVKDPYGWSVRLGEGVSSLFRTESRATLEAKRLCDGLKAHGVAAEVVIEREPAGPPQGIGAAL